MNEDEFKIIKLKSQRVRRNIDRWVFYRNRGYDWSWRKAIDQSARDIIDTPPHWLDEKIDS